MQRSAHNTQHRDWTNTFLSPGVRGMEINDACVTAAWLNKAVFVRSILCWIWQTAERWYSRTWKWQHVRNTFIKMQKFVVVVAAAAFTQYWWQWQIKARHNSYIHQWWMLLRGWFSFYRDTTSHNFSLSLSLSLWASPAQSRRVDPVQGRC